MEGGGNKEEDSRMGGEEGGRRKNTFASWPASAPLNPPFAGRSVGAFAQQAPHIPCLLQAGRRQKQGGEAHEWTARMGKGFNKKSEKTYMRAQFIP